MSELKKIPNVGAATEKDLIEMGYATVESLRGKKAEELYAEECTLRGQTLDRCQLYLLRAVEYYVNSPTPDIGKCKWWYWKDEYVLPSPCGTKCVECARFPAECGGCRKIEGKVFWLEYVGRDVCPIYECCGNKGMKNCGACDALPCEKFMKDPSISDEQNAANLSVMLDNLRRTI